MCATLNIRHQYLAFATAPEERLYAAALLVLAPPFALVPNKPITLQTIASPRLVNDCKQRTPRTYPERRTAYIDEIYRYDYKGSHLNVEQAVKHLRQTYSKLEMMTHPNSFTKHTAPECIESGFNTATPHPTNCARKRAVTDRWVDNGAFMDNRSLVDVRFEAPLFGR